MTAENNHKGQKQSQRAVTYRPVTKIIVTTKNTHKTVTKDNHMTFQANFFYQSQN